MISDEQWLECALDEAKKAFNKNEVPVGAIIVLDQTIIAKAYNLKETKKDALAHAELLALAAAQRAMNDWRLVDCVMYVTLEPCVMCAAALLHTRLKRVVYGAKDHKWGGLGSKINLNEPGLFNHCLEMEYLQTEECSALLTDFFKQKRNI